MVRETPLNKNEGMYTHYYRDKDMHRHLSDESIRKAEKEDD